MYRVDRHHSDGSFDSPYGGKSYALEWFARRMTNPNEFVGDLAFALYPEAVPQYSETYYLRNIMQVRLPAPHHTNQSPPCGVSTNQSLPRVVSIYQSLPCGVNINQSLQRGFAPVGLPHNFLAA